MTWYVACLSRDLGGGRWTGLARAQRPLARTVAGTPLALFRDGRGRAVALVDRCPHRNVPLSCGTVGDGLLQCCYHGWRFDGDGACREVPGLTGDRPDRRGRRATPLPTAEHDGFVWARTGPVPGTGGTVGGPTGTGTGDNGTGDNGTGDADAHGPYRFPYVGQAGYSTVYKHKRFAAGLHACLENTLDVPHTAFLHGGLFRGGRPPTEIEVVVRQTAAGVEAEYVGEPRPEGLAGRILAPEGGVVSHVDRFVLPSIAQVEYRLGENHLINTAAFTPVGERETVMHAAITFHLRLPHGPVRAAITPVANRILGQDSAILSRQAATIARFGGEHFASTELDVLGQYIGKLLRQQERGEAPSAGLEGERRFRMRV
ncbi:MAG: aromatic ring-hydroxylating dioxygenase subunit alpha [Actinomycetota bacterium]